MQRLYDLEQLTKKIWLCRHQWRCENKNIQFGLETSSGMQWFSYLQAPSKIVDIVCAFAKVTDQ